MPRRLLRVIVVVVVLAAVLLVVSVAWEPPWVASDPLATPYPTLDLRTPLPCPPAKNQQCLMAPRQFLPYIARAAPP